MYNIIPLLLILISLSIIIIIVVRKFSVLANLDVNTIPAEREARFKEQIISNRIKRNFVKWSHKFARLIKPAGQSTVNFFKWLHGRLFELKEKYKNDAVLHAGDGDIEEKIVQLFQEVEELYKTGELDGAEKKLIEIIGLDNKSIKAFKKLGDLYFERKSYEDAIQTFEHILKLGDDSEIYKDLGELSGDGGQRADTYFDLALTYEETGDIKKSIHNIQNALKVEPNNPRYLDTLLEISIINKDKVLATDAYDKLAKANPENKKLEEFKKQIDEL